MAALVARHNREMLEPAARCLEGSGVARPCDGDAQTGGATVDAHLVDSASDRIFANRFRAWASLPRSKPSSAKPSCWSGAYVQEHRDEISVRDLDSATFICVTTVEALTHEFIINKPDALDGDRDRFIDEVTRLVMGYLQPGRAA